MDNGTSMLCEQGDMALWNTPVSQEDQQKLNESAGTKKEEMQTDK